LLKYSETLSPQNFMIHCKHNLECSECFSQEPQPRRLAVERGEQDPDPLPLAGGHYTILPLLSVAGRAVGRMSRIQVRIFRIKYITEILG
jgi:hypothetical protein